MNFNTTEDMQKIIDYQRFCRFFFFFHSLALNSFNGKDLALREKIRLSQHDNIKYDLVIVNELCQIVGHRVE